MSSFTELQSGLVVMELESSEGSTGLDVECWPKAMEAPHGASLTPSQHGHHDGKWLLPEAVGLLMM